MKYADSAKVGRSALHYVLPMILELRNIGFGNVRFYSYVRWVGSLAVVIYQEMEFRARTGEALVYPRFYLAEFDSDLSIIWPNSTQMEMDRLAQSDCSIECFAQYFAERYICNQLPAEGCYSDEYYSWLNQVIAICPNNAFPITDIQLNNNKYELSETIEFFCADDRNTFDYIKSSSIPRPPGLCKMIEPRGAMDSAIAWNAARAAAKIPSGFSLWSRKINGVDDL